MHTVTAELLSIPGNNAVVRLDGRQFPGVLVQGDTLLTLMENANEILEHAKAAHDSAAQAATEALVEALSELLSAYEAACASHNIALPYVRTQSPATRPV